MCRDNSTNKNRKEQLLIQEQHGGGRGETIAETQDVHMKSKFNFPQDITCVVICPCLFENVFVLENTTESTVSTVITTGDGGNYKHPTTRVPNHDQGIGG